MNMEGYFTRTLVMFLIKQTLKVVVDTSHTTSQIWSIALKTELYQ